MVDYSDRLATALTQANKDAKFLADALGVSYQGVKKVIDGRSSAFNAENNSKAAKILGVSADWLACGTLPMERDVAPTPTVRQALQVIRNAIVNFKGGKDALHGVFLSFVKDADNLTYAALLEEWLTTTNQHTNANQIRKAA
jgi:hypothetical protein